MLAITPPGSNVDIAPSWLVDEATAHSKMELGRDERISAARKRANPKAWADPGKGRGDPKGGGRGGGLPKGGGRGKGAPKGGVPDP